MKRGLCFETAAKMTALTTAWLECNILTNFSKTRPSSTSKGSRVFTRLWMDKHAAENRHTFAMFHCEHVQNNNMTENYIQTSRFTHLHIMIISITLPPSANVTNLLSEARTT